MEELTVGVLRSWARTALAELGRARTEIDDLNVYPVPDGDTGTNLYLTWEAACDALPEGELTFAAAVQAFGRGALLGARGNSGVIASQLVRACGLRLAENLPPIEPADPDSAANSRAQLAEPARSAEPAAGSAEPARSAEPAAGSAEPARSAEPAGGSAEPAVCLADPGSGAQLADPVAGSVESAGGSAEPTVRLADPGSGVQLAGPAAGSAESAVGSADPAVRLADPGSGAPLAEPAAHSGEPAAGSAGPAAGSAVSAGGSAGPVAGSGESAADSAGPVARSAVSAAGSAEPAARPAERAARLAGPRMSEPVAFADALVFAADAAYGAVAQPVEGTMLTVARAAADAALAAANEGKNLAEVCLASVAAARLALTRTTEQLDVLRRAGVVDAGGAGLVVILGAMEQVLSGRGPGETTGVPGRVVPVPEAAGGDDLGPDGPAYEVMYLLDAGDELIAEFRRELVGLADSVVVVGGDGLWNVHAHTDDVGAVIERGIGIGRPHRIRVTHFADLAPHAPVPERTVIAVAAGDGLAALFEQAGAVVVRGGPGRRCSTGELLRAIEQSKAPEIVLLPNDKDSIAVAEAAAAAARQDGVRVAVIPTRAQVQGLAAIAVHDPERSFDDDVVHLSAAAGQTRHGAVTIAVKDAWTMAGTCRIGDALGVVDGDFTLITEDLITAATSVVDRLLGGGGELMTVVSGRDADPALVDAVVRHVRRHRKDVDVMVYDGGQERYPLLIGVE